MDGFARNRPRVQYRANSSCACLLRSLFSASHGRTLSRQRTRRNAELKWFLIEFCDRPGNNFAISTHALPKRPCAAINVSSSSADQGPLRTAGSRWHIHRSRHCLPLRFVNCLLTALQFSLPPCLITSPRSFSSSSLLQGILTCKYWRVHRTERRTHI